MNDCPSTNLVHDYMNEIKHDVDTFMRMHMDSPPSDGSDVVQALSHSLFAGGKRLRPILCIAAAESLGALRAAALPWSMALELIHTYTLIHDDLPALDNDDTRRGYPTCHVVYGEALAILAGLGLLAEAFVKPFRCGAGAQDSNQSRRILSRLSRSSGGLGILSGQVADLLAERSPVDRAGLSFIHHHKTAVLFSACLEIGGIIAHAAPADLDRLRRFGEDFGLAFQIQDDILDEVGDETRIGKPVGSDLRAGKSTFTSILGLSEARRLLTTVAGRAQRELSGYSGETSHLLGMLQFVITRDH